MDEALLVMPAEGLVRLRHLLEVADSPEEYFAGVDALPESLTTLKTLSGFWLDRPTLVGSAAGDSEDAPKLHAYLGAISRLAASDARLWTRQTHFEFRDYMSKRWPLNGAGWKSRLQDRWLMTNAAKHELVRNGVSRLWWSAELTRTSEVDGLDRYGYVRTWLSKQDSFLQIIDRDISMIPHLLFEVLDHIRTAPRSEAHIRELMKELVLVTGYSELAGLSRRQVADVISVIAEKIDAS